MPYPEPTAVAALPDSLQPLMIYHVGRHGARYATSPDRYLQLEAALQAHRSNLTSKGQRLLETVGGAIELTADRWGQLDSLGAAEQRGIARRMCLAFPQLVAGQQIRAESSYVSRCVASMEAFADVCRQMQGNVSTAQGEQFNYLLRPFQVDTAYVRWSREKPYAAVLNKFSTQTIPAQAIAREFINADFSEPDARQLAGDIYYCLSSLAAFSDPNAKEAMELLTPGQQNALWSTDNLRQYLSRTATTLSTLPADIAAPLVQDMIDRMDARLRGNESAAILLHFGHAETLMPLLSLMRLPACYYLTHYFDTVSSHWQSFHVVPMASNLQVILLRSLSGGIYLRLDLNERPIAFPGKGEIISYPDFKSYLQSIIP